MSNVGSVRWPQCYQIAESEVRAIKCSFLDELPSGVVLTGTPTAGEITTSDLTLGTPARNTTTIEIDGADHAANTAVVFTVAGALAGQIYDIRVSCATDGNPAETLVGIAQVEGVEDGT